MDSLSLQQAKQIANSSQFLVGCSFDKYFPNATPILCITPCPSNELLKERFVDDYDCFGTTDLEDYMDEKEFDVIVIARALPDKEVCIYVSLKTFLENNQVRMVA